MKMKNVLTILSVCAIIITSSFTTHAADASYINSKIHYKNLYPKTAIIVSMDGII